MTARQELSSWLFPGSVDVKPVPAVNSKAPSVREILFPREDGKPVVLAFLRHCGCPFAEKTFMSLRQLSAENPDCECIVVSHSDQESTDKWVASVGGAGGLRVIVDAQRQTYGAFGLGISNFWHVLNPWSMSTVFKLGREERIWNRPTESGTRWQTAGVFAVDSQGLVRYSHPAQAADDLGDLEAAVRALKSTAKL